MEGDAGESLALAVDPRLAVEPQLRVEPRLGAEPQLADRGDDLIQWQPSFGRQSSFDEGGVWRLPVELRRSLRGSAFGACRQSSFDWLEWVVEAGRSSPAGRSRLAG